MPAVASIEITELAQTTQHNPHLVPIERHGEPLEFDHVIVPFCDDKNYHTVIDRHMLYVGCTRAMHVLRLTHTGKPTRFLASAIDRAGASAGRA